MTSPQGFVQPDKEIHPIEDEINRISQLNGTEKDEAIHQLISKLPELTKIPRERIRKKIAHTFDIR